MVQRNGVETIFDTSDPLLSSSSTRGGDSNHDSFFQSTQRQFFEMEHGFMAGWNKASTMTAVPTHREQHNDDDYYYNGDNHDDGNDKRRHSMPMLQARRFLSYVRIWMVLSAIFLVVATGVLAHAFGHTPAEETSGMIQDGSHTNGAGTVTTNNNNYNGGASQQQYVVGGTSFTTTGGAQQIILVPMQDISNPSKRQQLVQQQQQQQQQQQFGNYNAPPQLQVSGQQHQHHNHPQQQQQQHGIRRALRELREEFDGWAAHHGKNYDSAEEKEKRFQIWTENHQRYVHTVCLTRHVVWTVSPVTFFRTIIQGGSLIHSLAHSLLFHGDSQDH